MLPATLSHHSLVDYKNKLLDEYSNTDDADASLANVALRAELRKEIQEAFKLLNLLQEQSNNPQTINKDLKLEL